MSQRKHDICTESAITQGLSPVLGKTIVSFPFQRSTMNPYMWGTKRSRSSNEGRPKSKACSLSGGQ
jgi:hypothetical protein